MKNLIIETRVVFAEMVLEKLLNSVQEYRERYPELGYIISGMEAIRQQDSVEELLPLLVRLNAYMRDKLFEYYVIRVMQHKFQQDLNAVQTGEPVEYVSETYLEFLGFKETTPTK